MKAYLKILFGFTVALSIALSVVSFAISKYLLGFVFLIISVLVFIKFFRYRIVKLKSTKSNSFVICDGPEEIEIPFEAVSYVYKWIRYNLTGSYLLTIAVTGCDGHSDSKYLLVNSKEASFDEAFDRINRTLNTP